MTEAFLSVSRYDWCISHPSSCILVNHGPLKQSCKEEYKPWKWGATTRYYTSHSKYHVTKEEVCAKIQQAIRPYKDLLTIVKRHKVQWYGHVSRSSVLAKTILQGTVKGGRRQGRQKKRCEDNIREWKGPEFSLDLLETNTLFVQDFISLNKICYFDHWDKQFSWRFCKKMYIKKKQKVPIDAAHFPLSETTKIPKSPKIDLRKLSMTVTTCGLCVWVTSNR